MDSIRTLVICEKPDAASRVAVALDENGSPTLEIALGIPLFQCARGHDTVTVCSAIGHLYSIDAKGRSDRRFYPVWDYAWRPKHEVERRSAGLSKWIQTINSLSRSADRFVNACDNDIEGSLIGHSVLQYACNGAHVGARRMKFSTMTDKELKAAFQSLGSQLDFSTVEAGRCRHEVDWIYGVNLSRVITEAALKQGCGYATLSTGRVQGPTLNFVVRRGEEISCFVPTPYWVIDAFLTERDRELRLEYSLHKIPTVAKANEIVLQCKGKLLDLTQIETNEIRVQPPYPFDLSALQSEAFHHFGYTPWRTLSIAERLYLDALISYPRTSSQKLPPEIGYNEIMSAIAAQHDFASLVPKLYTTRGKLLPLQGPKEDPAHPSIYPTGDSPKRSLSNDEANIFDLVTRRFLSTFAESCLRLESKMVFEVATHQFFLRGSKLLRAGWIEFYRPYASEESAELPDLKSGMQFPFSRIQALENFTEPPARYNPASLLRKMEEAGIGTKATRAETVDILYRRGYVKGIRMEPTPLGVQLIQLLATHCPLIIDHDFTSELETSLEEIQLGEMNRRSVITQAIDHLRPIMVALSHHEESLGVRFVEIMSARRTVEEQTFRLPCPQCGSPLNVVKNRKTGKRFVGCSGKWEKKCTFSLPLPSFGTLTILRRRCKSCGFQMIRVKSKRGRALVSCPRCYKEKRPSGTRSLRRYVASLAVRVAS